MPPPLGSQDLGPWDLNLKLTDKSPLKIDDCKDSFLSFWALGLGFFGIFRGKLTYLLAVSFRKMDFAVMQNPTFLRCFLALKISTKQLKPN